MVKGRTAFFFSFLVVVVGRVEVRILMLFGGSLATPIENNYHPT